MHEFDSQRGGEGDKDRVDHIEVKSSEKISQVTTGDTESRSTEGRHQSGSDGYTGDHISFQTRAWSDDAGQSAEESNKHIVDGRSGPG